MGISFTAQIHCVESVPRNEPKPPNPQSWPRQTVRAVGSPNNSPFHSVSAQQPRHGTARHGTARHGMARHGTARHNRVREGTAYGRAAPAAGGGGICSKAAIKDRSPPIAEASGAAYRLTPGPHRTRQYCSGSICYRPSAFRSVPSRQHRLRAPLNAVLRGRGSATGGDGGDASPPILRVRGIIPPFSGK